jgi:hypothetical protein
MQIPLPVDLKIEFCLNRLVFSAEPSGETDESGDSRGGEEAAWRDKAEDIFGGNQLRSQGLFDLRFDFIHGIC